MRFKTAVVGVMAVLVGSLAFSGAQAEWLKYDSTEGGKVGKITEPTRTVKVVAGEFQLRTSGSKEPDVQAFCVETGTNLDTNYWREYTKQSASTHFETDVYDNVKSLFRSHYDGTDQAAFQLALWETIHDTGDFDLESGKFQATRFWGARKDASQMLENLNGDYTHDFELHVLTNDYSQNLITWNKVPVPEPGTLALLGLGLLAMGFAMRRRMGAGF